ncbi:hypothetical protein DHA2_150412 [Giardia duodenalis]|uniref:Uncharacterized protein n=1 Tax=Giardia intestinalis TaxID=5741 RepID=V6T7G0_GIAIN|nr:hypothetical protein DHA2_150412 [Giardia intestinalis]
MPAAVWVNLPTMRVTMLGGLLAHPSRIWTSHVAHSEPARQPAQARLSEDGMIVDSKQGLSFTGAKGQLGALCNRRRCASVSRGVQRGLEIRPARRPEQSPTSARRWAWVSSSNQRDTTARRTRAQGGSRSSTG